MSTEHQRYSTENQSEAIRQYAARRHIEIVRTFADEGKSGLKIEGRDALRALILEVQAGAADFEAILVYDVSRWGRFQDADESAYYEYACRRAGIDVHYCAEQFENDGSPVSTIVKGVKRAMAGEYSRELSAKVWAGQSRLIELGFRQGGPSGYGLRRRVIDERGISKGDLRPGEQKNIQTDRVILVPGPPEEVDTVRWIYRAFVVEGKRESELADTLNSSGVKAHLGRPWTRGAVYGVLTNEKYIGNNVWNRLSFKLKHQRIYNGPEMIVRRDGVFEPLVDRDLFDAAQAIVAERTKRLTDKEILDSLSSLLSRKGYLSAVVIRQSEDAPCLATLRERFGSLRRVYELVGYTPSRDYRYIEINKGLRARHPAMVSETVDGIQRAGGHVVRDATTDLLTINGEFSASLLIVRCQHSESGGLFWRVRLDTGLQPDISIVVRMAPGNDQRLDYYLLPSLDLTMTKIRLEEHNGISLDTYRYDSLDMLFSLAVRTQLAEVA